MTHLPGSHDVLRDLRLGGVSMISHELRLDFLMHCFEDFNRSVNTQGPLQAVTCKTSAMIPLRGGLGDVY